MATLHLSKNNQIQLLTLKMRFEKNLKLHGIMAECIKYYLFDAVYSTS